MMLPGDMALLWDKKFKKYVELYAKDEDAFFKVRHDCIGTAHDVPCFVSAVGSPRTRTPSSRCRAWLVIALKLL
jgi:hypothetical protein